MESDRIVRRARLGFNSGDGSRGRPPQEGGSNEDIDHVAAGQRLQSPQAGRLGKRQPETRHLDELGPNPGGQCMYFRR
jgi:hypothetical protein